MRAMLYALDGWRALRFLGPDRKKYLHGLVTADVQGLAPGTGGPCCLLTPKGMLQAVFFLYDEGEALLALCPPEGYANLEAGVSKLLPLSETKLEKPSEPVWLSDGPDQPAGRRYPCPRFGERAFFFLGEAPAGAVRGDFEALRVRAAWPKFGVDVDDKTIPLEAGLDDALSFTKGCYMGQETISRIHHLGHVNRKLVRLTREEARQRGAAVTSAAGELTLAWLKSPPAPAP